MAVQLAIDYTTLIELVEQLSEKQQQDLMLHMLTKHHPKRALTVAEKLHLLEAATLHNEVNQTPSMRRIDEYHDDGR